MKRWTLLLAALLLATSVPAWAASEPKPAPGWELNDVTGTPHQLKDWRGQWVLLKLGTVQCPNCKILLRQLADVQDQLAAHGVHLIDIYLRNDRYSVKKYLEKNPIPLKRTVLYDWKGGLVRDYGVSMIPQLVLIDPEGRIRWEGRMTPASEALKVIDDLVPLSQASVGDDATE